ncbi:MAG: SCP-2 sterol transfer family protein, partial [Candidatus Dadabacteria bacterium]
MAEFLSDAWFEEVEKIREEHGDVPVPDALAGIQLNVVVTEHPEGDKEVHMNAGNFDRGHIEGAPATLKIPFEIAKKMFIEGDQQAGMQAFMAGQIQVEG